MNADGSNQTRLTNNFAGTEDDFPAWSPDGKKIAFASNRDGLSQIYVMDADGSHQTRLTDDMGIDEAPDWSPDGQKIVFVSFAHDAKAVYEIYVINADGSHETRLTGSEEVISHPSWSPDGQKIMYAAVRGGEEGLYVINADGSRETYLANCYLKTCAPEWSPDGSKIAFGRFAIFTMNADGSQPKLLVDTGDEASPTWSPDGRKIAFTSERDGNQEIYVMEVDGSGQTRLTDNPANDWNPDWSPAALPPVAGIPTVPPTSDTSSGAIGEMVQVPAGAFQMGCDPANTPTRAALGFTPSVCNDQYKSGI